MPKRNYILQMKDLSSKTVYLGLTENRTQVLYCERETAFRFTEAEAKTMADVFSGYRIILADPKWGIFNEEYDSPESQLCYAKKTPEDVELFFFSCNPDCKQLLFDSEQEAKAVLATLEKIAIKAESHYFTNAFVKEVSINA